MADQTLKKYILVAEDDRFYANLFKVKFTNLGYDVAVCADGQKALEEAHKRKPDLILLDLIMPVKDGYETLKELKADSQLKNVKVIVVSNLGQEEDIKQARNLGADDYVVKANVSISEMVDKVKNFL